MPEQGSVAVRYARGVMGGLIVGIPSMMTMEMWWEGFFVPAELADRHSADGSLAHHGPHDQASQTVRAEVRGYNVP